MKKRFSWVNPSLEVREIAYGKGIFAKKNIKKDSTLAIFGGYLITRAEEDTLPEKYNDYGLQISTDFVITSMVDGKNESVSSDDYFNHSCDPNAGFGGQIFLVAMRDINKKEEITFDYGTVLHRSKGAKPYKMKCLCGEKKCRKIITDNDWKKPELQNKYRGYFQYYLEQKIRKNKKK